MWRGIFLFTWAVALPAMVGAEAVGRGGGPEKVGLEKTESVLTPGTLRSDLQISGQFTQGNFGAMVPLISTMGAGWDGSGSLLFAEPYGTWISGGYAQAGMGLGFRHHFSAMDLGWAPGQEAAWLRDGLFIGTNLFVNMANAENDLRFWQLSPGIEVGARWVQLRSRYHIPISESYFVGNGFSQGLVTQNGPYTIRSGQDAFIEAELESLEGWEVEAEILVPGLDQVADVRVIAGYADFFSNDHAATTIQSLKAGIEARPVPAVVLSAMWYEDERLMGDNWFFGMGVEVPIGPGPGGGKGGFWKTLKSAFTGGQRKHSLVANVMQPSRVRAIPIQTGTTLVYANVNAFKVVEEQIDIRFAEYFPSFFEPPFDGKFYVSFDSYRASFLENPLVAGSSAGAFYQPAPAFNLQPLLDSIPFTATGIDTLDPYAGGIGVLLGDFR